MKKSIYGLIIAGAGLLSACGSSSRPYVPSGANLVEFGGKEQICQGTPGNITCTNPEYVTISLDGKDYVCGSLYAPLRANGEVKADDLYVCAEDTGSYETNTTVINKVRNGLYHAVTGVGGTNYSSLITEGDLTIGASKDIFGTCRLIPSGNYSMDSMSPEHRSTMVRKLGPVFNGVVQDNDNYLTPEEIGRSLRSLCDTIYTARNRSR